MRLEGTDIISAAGDRLATLVDGNLRMARGHAAERPVVEAWLEKMEAAEEVPPEPTEVPEVVVDVEEIESEVATMKAPPSGPMGDKDPVAIAWYFKHEPEKAVERYKNRKGGNLEPYKHLIQ